jgi:heme-binding protein
MASFACRLVRLRAGFARVPWVSGRGIERGYQRANPKENMRMKLSGIAMLGGAGIVFAGIAAAPVAGAAPCSASGATGTIGSVSTAASQYLAGHPGADQTLSNAISQSPDDARASVRAYFTSHPDEYVALKGITAPLVGLQNECGTAGLPMNLIDAFNEFQAG